MFKDRTELYVFTALSSIALHPAFAQTTDWSTPVQQGFTSLTTTAVTVTGALIGLAIVIFAAIGAATHKLEWQKLWVFVLAAAIIAAGPAAVIWAIAKFQASGA